jgi:hypothetical protein
MEKLERKNIIGNREPTPVENLKLKHLKMLSSLLE